MGKRLTDAEFLERFKQKFGNGYDLSRTVYSSAKKPVSISCITHGEFEATPDSLLARGRRTIACPLCNQTAISERATDTKNSFVKKAVAKFGDKYTYEQVKYENSQKPVTVTCSIHGDFEVRPASFLYGRGCKICSLERRHDSRRLKARDIHERLKQLYDGRISVEVTDYKNNRQRTKAFCSSHGEFEASYATLLSGKACAKCGVEKSSKTRRLTTATWIKKAKERHGERYDYSMVAYETAHRLVKIICREHGPFMCRPSNHVHLGRGCPGCSRTGSRGSRAGRSLKPRTSEQEFMKRIKAELNETNLKFDDLKFAGMTKKVRVVCPDHGVFWILPNNLLRGRGCKECATQKRARVQRLSIKDFIKRSSAQHSNNYDYSMVHYENLHEKVTILCREHGAWEVIAANHLRGNSGCPACNAIPARKRLLEANRVSFSDFLDRAVKVHGNKYSYSKSDSFLLTSKVRINCPYHGVFLQGGSHHLQGKGCPTCGVETRRRQQTSSGKEILKKFRAIHGQRYSYSIPDKVRHQDKIDIECKEHGVFEQLVRSHLEAKGCPKCSLSKGENAIALFLQRASIDFEVEYPVPEISLGSHVRFDFWLPDKKLFIEFDGEHHFRPVNFGGMSDEEAKAVHELVKERDARKDAWAVRNGNQVLRIRYDEDVPDVLSDFFGLPHIEN